jgi:holo-[acyl-carrier protein] synthase
MAIVGIGTDIVDVARIAALYEKHPQRFPERILTPFELEEMQRLSDHVAFLARRFAVKEAASKALGTGMAEGIGFADFEVRHDALGKPELAVYHHAAVLLRERGVVRTHLSIADEKTYAVAYVIFET